MIYIKACVVWIGLLLAIAALGAVREALLTPLFGEQAAHQIGTLAACAVVLAISYLFVSAFNPSSGEALGIGGLWLSFALAFELLFFHFIVGISWASLLADYNIFEGRLLVLLWLTTLLGPYAVVRLRRRIADK